MRLSPFCFVACILAAAAPASAAGLKAGVHAGYDDVKGGGGSGRNLGFDIGYDAPLGPLAFIGAMATYSTSTAKSCQALSVTDDLCTRTDDEYGAFGRIGASLPFGPRLYALGGGSRLRIRQTLTSSTTLIADDRDWRTGYMIGAGAEMPFAVFGYGKLEYRHANYNRGVSRDQVLLGVGIEF